jgi:hypothetical protein
LAVRSCLPIPSLPFHDDFQAGLQPAWRVLVGEVKVKEQAE